jgi:hypothetical protein
MSSSHPFFYIHYILDLPLRELIGVNRCWLICFRLFTALKVAPKMLEKSDLLLKFFWILGERILLTDILTIRTSSLIVVKVVAVRI